MPGLPDGMCISKKILVLTGLSSQCPAACLPWCHTDCSLLQRLTHLLYFWCRKHIRHSKNFPDPEVDFPWKWFSLLPLSSINLGSQTVQSIATHNLLCMKVTLKLKGTIWSFWNCKLSWVRSCFSNTVLPLQLFCPCHCQHQPLFFFPPVYLISHIWIRSYM